MYCYLTSESHKTLCPDLLNLSLSVDGNCNISVGRLMDMIDSRLTSTKGVFIELRLALRREELMNFIADPRFRTKYREVPSSHYGWLFKSSQVKLTLDEIFPPLDEI